MLRVTKGGHNERLLKGLFVIFKYFVEGGEVRACYDDSIIGDSDVVEIYVWHFLVESFGQFGLFVENLGRKTSQAVSRWINWWGSGGGGGG